MPSANTFTRLECESGWTTSAPLSDFILLDASEDRRRFEELLANRFPAVAAQIDEFERGQLHLEMGAFARATCDAIDRGDLKEIMALLSFIDKLFNEGAPDLENAIIVSYLEGVFLGRDDERYRAAQSVPSSGLQAVLVDLEEHWKKIAERSQERASGRRPPQVEPLG